MPPPITSGGISGERFKRGPSNFSHLSGTMVHTRPLDLTSLVSAGRLLNAIGYCTKVRKTGPDGQRVE